MERLNIVGCGRAGGTIANVLRSTGMIEIGQVLNRSTDSAQAAVAKLGAGEVAGAWEDFRPARYWMISTSDGAISDAAALLANSLNDLGGAVVYHLSGRFGPEILEAASAAGAQCAAVHPVRSMPGLLSEPEKFAGTTCVAEGSQSALEALAPLFRSAGAQWREVGELDRGLYHAALSLVSNVTKGVMWKAQNWLEAAGLDADAASRVSESLLSITADDVFKYGARHSITGPVVRGDTATVEAHLAALARFDARDEEIYRVLAFAVFELARERGDLDDAVLRRFEELLGRPIPSAEDEG